MRLSVFPFLLAILFAISVILSMASAADERPSSKNEGKSADLQDMQSIVGDIIGKYRGCKADVCFMIDGSKSIPSYDYTIQIEFVKAAAFLLNQVSAKTKFAALQYGGTPADVLSMLTSDVASFVKGVTTAPAQRYNVTSIGPALIYCKGLLDKSASDKRHIVLLGDGRTNFGPTDGPLGPVALGSAFRSRTGSGMTAVAVGFANIRELANIVGGRGRVLETRWWGPKVLRPAFMPLMDMICS